MTVPNTSGIRFPAALRHGDLIAVTAPSSGVTGGAALARLDLVLAHLRMRGYRVVEGECLRSQAKNASAPRHRRAAELMRFLKDPAVAAVMPPWGGELACDLLDLMDFDALRSLSPKWLLGFSDLSTLQLPLTLCSGWATAHGPNLMDLTPTQTDPLAASVLDVLAHDFQAPLRQQSSRQYQNQWVDYGVRVDAPLNLTEPTRWQRLDGSTSPVTFRGSLLGGCLDTLAPLAGTRYGDVPGFARASGELGTVLYLENAEMPPVALVRTLWGLRRNGWFDRLSGLLLGRSAGPAQASPADLSYREALTAVLADLPFAVLYDVDIGHHPPQFTLVNGAMAEVQFDPAGSTVTQSARTQALRR